VLPHFDALYFDNPFSGVLSFHDLILEKIFGQDKKGVSRPPTPHRRPALSLTDRITTILPAYPFNRLQEEAPVSNQF